MVWAYNYKVINSVQKYEWQMFTVLWLGNWKSQMQTIYWIKNTNKTPDVNLQGKKSRSLNWANMMLFPLLS